MVFDNPYGLFTSVIVFSFIQFSPIFLNKIFIALWFFLHHRLKNFVTFFSIFTFIYKNILDIFRIVCHGVIYIIRIIFL